MEVHKCYHASHGLDCYCLAFFPIKSLHQQYFDRSTAGVCRLRLAQLDCSIRSRARHERRLADRIQALKLRAGWPHAESLVDSLPSSLHSESENLTTPWGRECCWCASASRSSLVTVALGGRRVRVDASFYPSVGWCLSSRDPDHRHLKAGLRSTHVEPGIFTAVALLDVALTCNNNFGGESTLQLITS